MSAPGVRITAPRQRPVMGGSYDGEIVTKGKKLPGARYPRPVRSRAQAAVDAVSYFHIASPARPRSPWRGGRSIMGAAAPSAPTSAGTTKHHAGMKRCAPRKSALVVAFRFEDRGFRLEWQGGVYHKIGLEVRRHVDSLRLYSRLWTRESGQALAVRTVDDDERQVARLRGAEGATLMSMPGGEQPAGGRTRTAIAAPQSSLVSRSPGPSSTAQVVHENAEDGARRHDIRERNPGTR